MADRLNWEQFWPFYLEQHNNRKNRLVHVIGTTIALLIFLASIATLLWWLPLVALAVGYGFAWFGHAVYQKNKPATFTYPIKSFAGDWRLWWVSITRRADASYEAHGIEQS